MHGSLGWELDGANVVRTGSRQATELIYPDHLNNDLIQRQPYSALFERLKQFLLQPDTLLLTTGFSYSGRSCLRRPGRRSSDEFERSGFRVPVSQARGRGMCAQAVAQSPEHERIRQGRGL